MRNWSFAVLTLLALFFVYKLYVEKEWFTIHDYTLVGVDEEVRNELLPLFKENSLGVTFFLFPKDKILSYSHADIVRIVSEKVPSRSEITIHPTGLHELTIEVTEFTPVFKLSDTVGVTKEGIVFDTKRDLPFPTLTAATTTETFRDNGFTLRRLKEYDAFFLENLVLFSEKINTILFPVDKIEIRTDGDVHLYGDDGVTSIIFTKGMNLEKAWSTLVSAIDTDPLKSSLEKEKERLLYIDLRFGNKVFYKFGDKEFQNASSTVIIDDHATTTPRMDMEGQ